MTQPAKKRGRKPRGINGEKPKNHNIRWLDAEWADACYIGHARVRELVTLEAVRQRRIEAANEKL